MPLSWNAVSRVEALESIRGRARLAVVLGSGLSGLPSAFETVLSIPYAALPGFRPTSVEGHEGRLALSRIGGSDVLLFAGRFHAYEGLGPDECGAPVSLAASLGCERVVLTQAAGSLARRLRPGSWLVPSDIVTLPTASPIARCGGPARSARAERPGARAALISRALRLELLEAARAAGIAAAEGSILWTAGPAYETAAEARAAALIGAQAATMSGLPELVAARSLGLEAALASWITNYATHLARSPLDHAEVCRLGAEGTASLAAIVTRLAGAAP